MWYARSAEFTQSGLMDTLRWMRVIGDTIFAIGVVALAWFVIGLKTGWSVTGEVEPAFESHKGVSPSRKQAPARAKSGS